MSTGKRSTNRNPQLIADNLPDAELEVMACLWQKGSATVRDLRHAMAHYRPMTHGSMATLLKRLETKHLVSKKKAPVGKAFVYEPTRGPRPAYRRIMRDLCERIFGGSGLTMVSSLFETRPPSLKELDELQTLLNTLRARSIKKESKK